MAPGQLVQPELHDGGDERHWREHQQIVGALSNQTDWAVPLHMGDTLTVEGDALFKKTLEVDGTLLLDNELEVNGPVTFNATLDVLGKATFGEDVDIAGVLTVEGDTHLGGPLTVVGPATLEDNLHVKGTTLLDQTLHVVGAATLDSTLAVAGAATFAGNVTLGDAAADAITINGTATFTNPVASLIVVTLTVTGNTTLGDAAADTITVNGTTHVLSPLTVRSPSYAVVPLFVDPVNNRTIVGSASPLSGAANDLFSVIYGMAHFAAPSLDTALGLRYAPTTAQFFIGASDAASMSSLVFRNSAGTQIARVLGTGGMVVGPGTAVVGSERLRVMVGGARIEGAVTITAGGLAVDAGPGSNVSVTHTNALTATSCGAGTASPLPGAPAIYLYESVNGVLYRRPLWL